MHARDASPAPPVAAPSVDRQRSSGLGLLLLGNAGNLVLLSLPWMHVECHMNRETVIAANVRGMDIALNQPAPELRDLPWNRGRKPTLDWHVIFLAIPALGTLLCIGMICNGGFSKTLTACMALGAIGILLARGYFWIDIISVLEHLRAELDGSPLEVTWLWPFWLSFIADALVFFSANGLTPDASRAHRT